MESDTVFTLSTKQYENRIVILIDIIGFKDFIAKKAHSEIAAFFGEIEKEISEGEVSKHGAALSYVPAFLLFSDTIFISFPCEVFSANKNHAMMLFNIQVHVKRIQLYCLKWGLLTRGCVSYGLIHHNGQVWFGPALIEAHTYESELAMYPRVILAPSLIKLLEQEIDRTIKNGNVILESDDGFYYIDYLGWIHTEFNDDYVLAHKEVQAIITSNLEKVDLPEKAKAKWKWLACYFNRYTKSKLTHLGDQVELIELVS